MIIFRDCFSNDEVCSDVYPHEVIDGCVLKVTGKRVTKIEGGDYGIGGGGEDGEDVGVDDPTAVSVINVVDAHGLTETNFDKKTFMTYIKGYVKKVLGYLKENKPDRVAAFQSEAQAFVKKILGNFKEYQFFLGPAMDTQAMVVLCDWAEDGVTPRFYFWNDGLIYEKV
eukprot:CAMPEP_0201477030 /NCGR_PEP_ID=MMETSP0151_2-20130828/2132_1 /ASSEMBLY_ACC=CAM_ASM_000257 /TAXON_ID=200890 /ORGANISM="Paramoeba atlantica, Strain 621/1 / CCAP 1560/9" /LENGTH=168 /DNA_ID=CAMNT_0047857631 /DNA_START=98 /DNA_END=604 /DNA_ORIENTATION=+